MSFYVTTPIYYVNAEPHLGHAYTTVIADVVARFAKLKGEDVFFLTGTDEHGDKIVQAAQKKGISPQEYVDSISKIFQETWPLLNISYSRFIRTTEPKHKQVVQWILDKIYAQGDIYFDEYEGLYCFGCERFLTEKELKEGLCPDHKCAPVLIKEANYFFKLSKYQSWLVRKLEENPHLVTPERYRKEILSFLRENLEDLCISRPKSRLTWGIELPFDKNFVTYVWFDALINYLSGIGFPEDSKWQDIWPAHHIIAKDILKPHAVYWPIMLKALGIPLFKQLHVHGYWNMGEAKMSKSLGNIVTPSYLVNKYGCDQVRYFLLREMAFGLDANFSEEALKQRINADLANDLGNLVFRSLTMLRKYFKEKVPPCGERKAEDLVLWELAQTVMKKFQAEMEAFKFHRALASLWELIRATNKYIDSKAPWKLMKEGKREDVATVLYTLLEILRIVAIALWPVCPNSAEKILKNLSLNLDEHLSWSQVFQWGVTKPHEKARRGEILFPRIESLPKKEEKVVSREGKSSEEKEEISFDIFKKLDLRVAKIIRAERISGTDRLLKLIVLCPEERTIVAGLAEYYDPKDLVGKEVVLLANLKPAKIKGVLSQGMILAAKGEDSLVILSPEKEVPLGAKIS